MSRSIVLQEIGNHFTLRCCGVADSRLDRAPRSEGCRVYSPRTTKLEAPADRRNKPRSHNENAEKSVNGAPFRYMSYFSTEASDDRSAAVIKAHLRRLSAQVLCRISLRAIS